MILFVVCTQTTQTMLAILARLPFVWFCHIPGLSFPTSAASSGLSLGPEEAAAARVASVTGASRPDVTLVRL
jgi:hypothetical protein